MTSKSAVSSVGSAIALLDPVTGNEYPSAGSKQVVLSSAGAVWNSPLIFELHQIAADEFSEHTLINHRLVVNLGPNVPFGWKRGDRKCEAIMPTGGLCLQTEGDSNAPFWRAPFEFAAVAIPHSLIESVLEERAPAAQDTFLERRCLEDKLAHAFVQAIAVEVEVPGEPLRAEMLCLAFTLHLLSLHGRSPRTKRLAPKGKLNSGQLRAVVDAAQAGMTTGLTLAALAEAAGLSVVHFTHLFSATVGIAPHQFIVRLRVEKAKELIERNVSSLGSVALQAGFFDQSHMTNVFKRLVGTTPAAWRSLSGRSSWTKRRY